MYRIVTVMLSASLLCGAAYAETPKPTPIRVLILSGQNNHNWKQTTPKIKAILEAEDRCAVDVTEHPEMLTAEQLRPYDVIVSNWNTFARGKNVVKIWPDATQAAYVEFVRRGGGHVVVHAGSSSFYDWPEYQRLCLATWKLGQTNHGRQHTFEVRVDDAEHPVTRDVEHFKTHDELWCSAGIDDGVHVIASAQSSTKNNDGTDRWEPIAMVGEFGQGRSFTLLLGHEVSGMNNEGFQTLLRHGVSWAANQLN